MDQSASPPFPQPFLTWLCASDSQSVLGFLQAGLVGEGREGVMCFGRTVLGSCAVLGGRTGLQQRSEEPRLLHILLEHQSE